jgi:insulysin
MLILGSEKYPGSDHFRKSLSLNAGRSAALTGDQETSFFFQVQNDAFFQILDIFSRFFIDPLLDLETMEREIHAVHSEWKNTLANQEKKIWFLLRVMSQEGHPFAKFSTGNLQTLLEDPKEKNLSPQVELRKFFRSKYSANLMSLVVYTNEQ